MDPANALTDPAPFFAGVLGALIFGGAFLFLYRQSRIVYFQLWAAAWALRFLAAVAGVLLATGFSAWLAVYATFEFAFAIVLLAAARAGFSSERRDWRRVLRIIAVLPVLAGVVFVFGGWMWGEGFQAWHAIVLCFVYFYNFLTLRTKAGVGARVLRFSLVLLAAAFLVQAVLVLDPLHNGAGRWVGWYLHKQIYWEQVLHGVVAFAAMAMWSDSQGDRIGDLTRELDHLRRESANGLDLDRLTGLRNQSALAARVEDAPDFDGVVVVCDMDNFKEINDRYGHLVGDEILRNIGHLLKASIRLEDEAFRWGGDEFVVLFHDQREAVAMKRMAEIDAHLREFRIRGFGVLPISFSWGTAEAHGRALREALDAADHAMYRRKRARAERRAISPQ